MNLDPKTTRTILVILAALVAVVGLYAMTRDHYGDPARELIEREAARQKGAGEGR